MLFRPFDLPAIVICLSLGLLPCSAQNDSKVSLRFLSFPKAAEPLKIELQLTEDKTLGIEAPSNEFSPPVKVDAPGVWSVGETAQGPDGKTLFKEYGRTKAPVSPQQMLLLVRKGEKNSDGIDLIALDGRVNEFGGGKFLFMNAARVDIAGVVGEQKFVVKPGQHIIIKPKSEGEQGLTTASFYFRKNGEPRAFFSSRWPIGDHARGMVFFYHDPESLHIRMHTIRDFM
jgi:hypothetical protein